MGESFNASRKVCYPKRGVEIEVPACVATVEREVPESQWRRSDGEPSQLLQTVPA